MITLDEYERHKSKSKDHVAPEDRSCPHEEVSVHTRGVWLVCEHCGEYLEWSDD